MIGDRALVRPGDTSGYRSLYPLVSGSGMGRINVVPDDQESLPEPLELVRDTVARASVYFVQIVPPDPAVSAVRRRLEAQLSLVQPGRLYRMENEQTVQRFLRSHPEVRRVLVEAQDYVTEYFGADAEVVLEVIQDPDVSERSKLIARVVTDKPIEEAFGQLQAFARDWFTAEFARADGLVNFDVTCA